MKVQSEYHTVPQIFRFLLAGLAFSAFLTGTKLLPFLRNNVGIFEILIVVLALALSAHFYRQDLPIRFNWIIGVLAAIAVVGLVSQFNVPSQRLGFTLVQGLILFSLLLFAVLTYNLFVLDPQLLVFFLRCLAYAGVAIALWLFVDQIRSGGAIDRAGPFRNRTHAGIYMFSAFWFAVIYLFLPHRSKLDQLLLYPALGFMLYGIAVAGRRSLYIAFIVALVALPLGLVLLRGIARLKSVFAPLVFVLLVSGLYFFGSQYVPQLRFFQARVGMVGARVTQFYTAYTDFDEEEVADSDDFIALQRRGGLQAFSDYPLLGIGYGAFFESEYSPTGHEMHSTPLKFLAETGIVGFFLYLVLMGLLFGTSIKTFLVTRGGPFQISALVLLIMFVSGSVSYIYNRQTTDRTFWILLACIASFPLLLTMQAPETESIEESPAQVEPGNVWQN